MVQATGSIKIEPLPSTSDVLLPGSKCPNVSDAQCTFEIDLKLTPLLFDVAWKEMSQKKVHQITASDEEPGGLQ